MKVTHVLRDGTELDDIQGHVVKKDDAEAVYSLMDVINQKEKRGKNEEKEPKKK
jgi:hypothetical protein